MFRILKFLNLRFYEAYLTYLYLGIKLLFLINVLVQLDGVAKLFCGQPYCDMEIRILGHVQRHTVQCVLVINIFTEKVNEVECIAISRSPHPSAERGIPLLSYPSGS
ncbi:hypothetical protein COOONC_07938 [Cooperia oncophora]